MQKKYISSLVPHVIAIFLFFIVCSVYCRPAFQGKVLSQSDVIQWKGMAQYSFAYKEKHGHFPLWTEGMFSGMPAYQIAMEPDVPVTPNSFYNLLILHLPKPANFFFLACLCFYFLTQVLRVNPYAGMVGAIAYAYATYNPGIILAGHETKMVTIGLAPAFLGSLMLIYEGKYLWGAALTSLFTGLLVSFNHLQFVYYVVLISVFMTAGYLFRWILRREWRSLLMAGFIALGAGALGVFSNAVTILTTLDAAKTTIRGGSELAGGQEKAAGGRESAGEKGSGGDTGNEEKKGGGLDKDYAMSYSMKNTEPFVMLSPDLYGGAGVPIEQKVRDSKAEEALQSMPPSLSSQIASVRDAYWGGIGPIAPAAPNYIGAIICLLAVFGLVLPGAGRKHRGWVMAACVLSIVMSWGSYFPGFNGWLLEVLPMYNKFRAPSMILFIPTLLLCMMAVLGLQQIVFWDEEKGETGERGKSEEEEQKGNEEKERRGKGSGEKGGMAGGAKRRPQGSGAAGDAGAKGAGKSAGEGMGAGERKGAGPGGLPAGFVRGLLCMGGLFLVLLLIYFGSDFRGEGDRQLAAQLNGLSAEAGQAIRDFLSALIQDRQHLFLLSLLRSFIFILAAAVLCWLLLRRRLNRWLGLGLIGGLVFIDLIAVDQSYLNTDSYQDAEEVHQNNFTPTAADRQVLQDTGYYRVFDLRQGLSTLTYGAMTAYFHRSIGGYHPAKLSLYQDLIEGQLTKFPDCKPVVNMLNTKYILRSFGSADTVFTNEAALGAAWFVRGIRFGKNAREVMDALSEDSAGRGFDPRDTAIIFWRDRGFVGNEGSEGAGGSESESGAGAAVDGRKSGEEPGKETGSGAGKRVGDRGNEAVSETDKGRSREIGNGGADRGDGGDSIRVLRYDGDELEYLSHAAAARFAVFSEIYYDRGWKAFVDGKEAPIIRTNYVLRGLNLPGGTHRIRFVFHPAAYYTGEKIALAAGIGVLLLLLAAAVVGVRRSLRMGR